MLAPGRSSPQVETGAEGLFSRSGDDTDPEVLVVTEVDQRLSQFPEGSGLRALSTSGRLMVNIAILPSLLYSIALVHHSYCGCRCARAYL